MRKHIKERVDMKKSHESLNKIVFCILCILFSIYLAYSSCVLQFMVNADDVGEIYKSFLHYGLGIKQYTVFDYLKPDAWRELLVYFLFGIKEKSIYISFFVQLFTCNLLTFFVSTYFFEDKQKYCIIFFIYLHLSFLIILK